MFRQPFAENWGDGTMSSSDGQRFKASGKAESTGTSIPSTKANRASSSTLISLISTRPQLQVVNVSVRDSTFVLDGCSHCPSGFLAGGCESDPFATSLYVHYRGFDRLGTVRRRTRKHGSGVDLKLQFDNRLPGPHAQLLMCKTKIALANIFLGC
jgi:hypothetical protein